MALNFICIFQRFPTNANFFTISLVIFAFHFFQGVIHAHLTHKSSFLFTVIRPYSSLNFPKFLIIARNYHCKELQFVGFMRQADNSNLAHTVIKRIRHTISLESVYLSHIPFFPRLQLEFSRNFPLYT